MNLVYPLKAGSSQEEIRYSLRTVKKFLRGVEDIYVLGTQKVPGTTLIKFHDTLPRPTANTYAKARHAATLMDRFLWMNDDIYFTRPIHVDEIPLIHKGPLPPPTTDPNSKYENELRHTHSYLRSIGIAVPLSFEVHAPMPIVSEIFLEKTSPDVCTKVPIVLWRSLYGNLSGLPSVQMEDNKVFGHQKVVLDAVLAPFFVSSSNQLHPALRRWLQGL